jgi:hypothetical protein
VTSETMFIEAVADVLLHLVDRISELFGDGLAPQRFNIEVVGSSRHDDECDDRHFGFQFFQLVIESRQRLDEEIRSFVGKLIATSNEEVQSFFQVEVVVAVKMASHKVVDLLLGECVEVLELMEGHKFLDRKSVGGDDVGGSLERYFEKEKCQSNNLELKLLICYAKTDEVGAISGPYAK